MIHPAPTTQIDPALARGTFAGTVNATATQPALVVMTYPNTSYQMHLVCAAGVSTPVGKRCIGTIHAQAKRVDVVRTGGKYIDPVIGKPRRIQGRVVSTDPSRNVVVIDAGVPFHCTLTDARQQASDFNHGDVVACGLAGHSTFTQTNG
ncbi:MAG: hypothetical protein H6815_09065 [Phycisphaeraceae bacterium]|nr:hypothetical protein [Phycisphaerales bacterium]MCB9860589.1 hypothetical protein [Phycisphaeraceae bacterium]